MQKKSFIEEKTTRVKIENNSKSTAKGIQILSSFEA
jgi:hypothetical protein